MRVFIRNGYLIADWEGKPERIRLTKEDLDCLTSSEREFLRDIRYGNFEQEEPYVDLRYEPFKLSKSAYLLYNELNWVSAFASKYGIEIDDSFTQVYEPLRDVFSRVYAKTNESYIQSMTRRAEELWEETKKDISDKCAWCAYCADAVDGDLYCERYRRFLEVDIEDTVDMQTNKHYMFASRGIKLDCCKEREKALQEEEKKRFIADYVYGQDNWWAIRNEVIQEMKKYF